MRIREIMFEADADGPVTPAALTKAIQHIIGVFLAKPGISSVRAIGDGLCYEFTEAVFETLGAETDYLHGTGPSGLQTINTEDFWRDEWVMDIPILRKLGEPIPKDLPPKDLASLLGAATHQWIKLGHRHYDATAPQGVDHFLELPFFADQIAGLRAKRRATKRSGPISRR